MKEIKAYIRPSVLDRTITALEKIGAKDITVIQVNAIGTMADSLADREHFFRKYNEKYSDIAKLEIVCLDEEVDRFVVIIKEQARTGGPGDGRIFVADILQAVNIRTGNEREEAL